MVGAYPPLWRTLVTELLSTSNTQLFGDMSAWIHTSIFPFHCFPLLLSEYESVWAKITSWSWDLTFMSVLCPIYEDTLWTSLSVHAVHLAWFLLRCPAIRTGMSSLWTNTRKNVHSLHAELPQRTGFVVSNTHIWDILGRSTGTLILKHCRTKTDFCLSTRVIKSPCLPFVERILTWQTVPFVCVCACMCLFAI